MSLVFLIKSLHVSVIDQHRVIHTFVKIQYKLRVGFHRIDWKNLIVGRRKIGFGHADHQQAKRSHAVVLRDLEDFIRRKLVPKSALGIEGRALTHQKVCAEHGDILVQKLVDLFSDLVRRIDKRLVAEQDGVVSEL